MFLKNILNSESYLQELYQQVVSLQRNMKRQEQELEKRHFTP